MILRSLLDSNAVLTDDSISCRREALEKISLIASTCTGSGPEGAGRILQALESREEMGSTALGGGVAIPHCRLDISGFCVGFLVIPDGIPFDAPDGGDVHFLPFVVGPSHRPKEHLSVLSSMVQLMRIPDIKEKMLECRDSSELSELLSGHLDPSPDQPLARTVRMKLVTIFIQDETLFDEVLQIFTAVESVYAMVLEAHESTDYLRNMSLFAGFWNMEVQQFNRIIMAAVREELVNSTVRNIEYICGDLSDRNDILITISDLHRVIGSLSH